MPTGISLLLAFCMPTATRRRHTVSTPTIEIDIFQGQREPSDAAARLECSAGNKYCDRVERRRIEGPCNAESELRRGWTPRTQHEAAMSAFG
jgi:hypothetical protein